MGVIRTAVLLVAAVAALAAQPTGTERWEQWKPLPGVFDIVGPRADGKLVAAGTGRLFLVDPVDGSVTPYADGPGGYRTDAAYENYIALAPGLRMPDAGCSFTRDDVFALELGAPLRVIRVDTAGQASTFAELPGTEFLSGITFDDVGRFANRLLVTARKPGGRTSVLALDCRGRVTTISDDGPVVEGGIAVAPATFGRFAGLLIAPDEHGGDIVAFRPDGGSEVVVHPNLAVGADVGVESLGFVPRDFFPLGAAYVADRLSPGAPTLGTDTVLRLTGAALARGGVRQGDLLVSTESAGRTIAVRCEATCTAILIAQAADAAHLEGHVTAIAAPAPGVTTTAVTTTAQSPSPREGGEGDGPVPLIAGVAVVALVLGLTAAVAARRRGRSHS